MKSNSPLFLRIGLIIGDIFAIVVAFLLAYWARVYLDERPFQFIPNIWQFSTIIILMIPLWVTIISLTGLYLKSIFLYRSRSYGRLMIVSVISVMSLITYEFISGMDVFPVRVMAIYFVPISWLLLIVFREIIQLGYRILLRAGVGRQNIIIVGNTDGTISLAKFFNGRPGYGYNLMGVVAQTKYVPVFENKTIQQFSSVQRAIDAVKPDIIIQTDKKYSEHIYDMSVRNHILYMFVPNEDIFMSGINEIEIIGGKIPIISVNITRLLGNGRFIKRIFDLLFSTISLIILAIPMMIIAILIKITDPRGEIFFKQERLTKFGKTFMIYKFRSMKNEFSGISPEEAFKKMDKPELAKIYRDNGDQLLGKDPRVTKIGAFLRATSLDELPQLFNVWKGDISLIGPRALVQYELSQYKNKDLILSVKSGVTGLAQISGRRDISFDERRRLDVYYVQNWTFLLDMQILIKTILYVILRRGAK